MRTIAKHGAVVTEYPPSALPEAHHFPRRNRIISGLCQGTLVIEGSMSSGALITASYAIAQGRELFALPGKVDEAQSDGPNELLRSGAHVALSAEDILCYYDFLYHDDIDFGALKKAKQRSAVGDDILRRYGVSPEKNRGRKNDRPIEDKPSEAQPIATPTEQRTASPKVEMAQQAPTVEANTSAPDQSERLLASVDATTRRVFELMPTDKAVTADQLAAEGVEIGDVITALTLLEIVGLVNTLPGGMYIRR